MQITIPQVKWGKRKERSQMLEAFTVDGRIVEKEYIAYENFVDDGQRAFLLDGENQYFCKEDRTWHQVVSEIDYVPLALRVPSKYADGKNDEQDKRKLSNALFELTFNKKQAEQFTNAKVSDAWNNIKWIFTIVFGTFAVIGTLMIVLD